MVAFLPVEPVTVSLVDASLLADPVVVPVVTTVGIAVFWGV